MITLTRPILLLVRQAVERLMADDCRERRTAAEPWAYNRVLSDIDRELDRTDKPIDGLSYGRPVYASTGAPARYLAAGLCLWISAQDNDFAISPVSPGSPTNPGPDPRTSVLPDDRQLAAAATAYRYALPGGER